MGAPDIDKNEEEEKTMQLGPGEGEVLEQRIIKIR
jgi:hypothetical protein